MKTYIAPSIEEIGTVATMTAAIGTSTREDFSEFTGQRGEGSFDVCDGNPNNTPDPSFCVGR